MKNHRPLMLLWIIATVFSLFSCVPQEKDTPKAEPGELVGTLSFEGRRYRFEGDSSAVASEEDVLTILQAGRYLITGKLNEGRIRVCAEGAVVLLLDGAEICSSYGPVISGERGATVFIEAAKDSVNLLRSKAYGSHENMMPAACVYSEGKLIFCGGGKTVIDTDASCGAASLSEIEIRGADLSVNSIDFGVWARDRFLLSSGRLTVSNSRVGVFADDRQGAAGAIEIIGGELSALCSEIALWSGRSIVVKGGSADLDVPLAYRCERTEGGKRIEGEISILSEKYPAYNTNK